MSNSLDLDQAQAWSGSKLFAKVISRRQLMRDGYDKQMIPFIFFISWKNNKNHKRHNIKCLMHMESVMSSV